MKIQVVYAKLYKQKIWTLDVDENTSMIDAVKMIDFQQDFPNENNDWGKMTMGVFGKVEKNPENYILQENDRIEIYHPLIADPKEIRRNKASKAKF